MPRMRWRPGLRPGPRWGISRRSPRSPSRLGRGTPPPLEPHPNYFTDTLCLPPGMAFRYSLWYI